MKRSHFLQQSLYGLVLTGVLPTIGYSQQQQTPLPFELQIVKDFVVAGHKDLTAVKDMLKEKPNLLYACYDWGNGDFETALEGAGHMGNKEIAEYLLSQGARPNLFVLTMLGNASLVLPILDAYPSLIFAKGPHGFTLLHHAQKGGARELEDYLSSKGLKETNIKIK